LGINDDLHRLARTVAVTVVVGTTGVATFAGDRGLLHPELTAAATRAEASGVATREFDVYVSCNRSCELGMTRATGREYQHILEILEAATA